MPASPSPLTASRPQTSGARPSSPPSASFAVPDTVDVEALQNREAWAVRAWIYEERDFIRRVLIHYGVPHHDLREQVQEMMHQALRSLPTFTGRSKITTWLYGVTRNIALQSARDRKRHILMEPSEVASETPSTSAYGAKPGIDGPDVVATRRERTALVQGALEHLPPHFAEVIRLRDLGQQSTAETAEALGITRGNARVRLHRARKALRDLLAPFFAGSGEA